MKYPMLLLLSHLDALLVINLMAKKPADGSRTEPVALCALSAFLSTAESKLQTNQFCWLESSRLIASSKMILMVQQHMLLTIIVIFPDLSTTHAWELATSCLVLQDK